MSDKYWPFIELADCFEACDIPPQHKTGQRKRSGVKLAIVIKLTINTKG